MFVCVCWFVSFLSFHLVFAVQFSFARRRTPIKIIEMEHILKYFALTTIVLAGATGKFLNGPWIINKIDEYSHPQVRVPGQALSPVIFGDFLFLLNLVKVQVHQSTSNYRNFKFVFFLVPGDGGSRIEARLNKPSTVHYFCDKTTKDWFNLWLNLELLAPLIIDCWTDNVKLHYDVNTRTTSNSPGVETRVPGWGRPEVVEWIDPSQAVRNCMWLIRWW